jgi:hypothetical protein
MFLKGLQFLLNFLRELQGLVGFVGHGVASDLCCDCGRARVLLL